MNIIEDQPNLGGTVEADQDTVMYTELTSQERSAVQRCDLPINAMLFALPMFAENIVDPDFTIQDLEEFVDSVREFQTILQTRLPDMQAAIGTLEASASSQTRELAQKLQASYEPILKLSSTIDDILPLIDQVQDSQPSYTPDSVNWSRIHTLTQTMKEDCMNLRIHSDAVRLDPLYRSFRDQRNEGDRKLEMAAK